MELDAQAIEAAFVLLATLLARLAFCIHHNEFPAYDFTADVLTVPMPGYTAKKRADQLSFLDQSLGV